MSGCMCLDYLGERERARACLAGLSTEAPFLALRAMAFRNLASIARDDLALGEAESALRSALELAPETAPNPHTAGALISLGQVVLGRGDVEGADDLLRRAGKIVSELNLWGSYGVDLETARAEVLLARGEVKEGIAALTAVIERENERHREVPWALARTRFVLARALVAEDPGARAQAVELARRAHDDLSLRGHLADGERARIEDWLAAQGS